MAANWIAGLLAVLLCGVKRCAAMLNLLAIKGGAACDCEIKFIGKACMKGKELGAEVVEFRQVEDDEERID